MRGGPETHKLEELLRRRGTSAAGNAEVEKEILERYQDACAVLILDSSGFTRITQEHGIIHFLALVVAMRDLARPCLERHHAYGIWGEADNVYAIFDSAVDAVQAALDIQDVVQAENKNRAETDKLPVCIGVGYGRMLRIGGEDVFGDQMNLASKIGEDIAAANEVLCTDVAWYEVAAELPAVMAEPRAETISGVDISYRALTRKKAGDD